MDEVGRIDDFRDDENGLVVGRGDGPLPMADGGLVSGRGREGLL